MVYERNPDYHRGPAKIRQVIHKFVPDQLVLYGQGRTGEVDYVGLQGVPYDRWNEAKQLPNATFFSFAQPWVQFIYFNCGKPQFSDPKVRKALYTALEMQRSIDDIYFGAYPRTLSYLAPTHWAYNHALKEETPNPDLAAKMLDEAGWRVGQDGVREKDGVKLAFTMSTTAGNQARQGCQALFQQNWKKIGVDMQIKNMPASVVWGEYTTQSQFDTLLVAWEPTVGMDPDYTARAHSKMIPVKDHQGSNYVQYQNPEVDKLLEAGVVETDTEKRKEIYGRVQEILLEEVPFAPQGGDDPGLADEEGPDEREGQPVRDRRDLEHPGLVLELTRMAEREPGRAIVVGAGIAGLSLAWALRRRGFGVDLYEQGPIPNPVSSSFDEHRVTRHAYGAMTGYARMMPAAFRVWDRLWAELGASHYEPCGMVYFLREGAEAWHEPRRPRSTSCGSAAARFRWARSPRASRW